MGFGESASKTAQNGLKLRPEGLLAAGRPRDGVPRAYFWMGGLGTASRRRIRGEMASGRWPGDGFLARWLRDGGSGTIEGEEIFTAKSAKEDLGLKRNAENGENAEEVAESCFPWRSWRLGGLYSSRQCR